MTQNANRRERYGTDPAFRKQCRARSWKRRAENVDGINVRNRERHRTDPRYREHHNAKSAKRGRAAYRDPERRSRITAWVKVGQACKMNNMSIFLK